MKKYLLKKKINFKFKLHYKYIKINYYKNNRKDTHLLIITKINMKNNNFK